MSARYFTLVSHEMLPFVRDCPIEGLRMIRIVEAPTPPWAELVEFEDDGAPESMNGQRVSPVISSEYEQGKTMRVWVSDRYVEATP